nr:monocarboxylate transporter 12-like [Parasteatoda tepidariorum]
MAIWNLSGPIAGALSYKWSIRTITFAGVLLVTTTNIICWFAKDITIITFFLGGLQGFGVGMAVTLVPVMINQYFVKYKSTGAGIACAGATAGSFALPPIVEFAIEEYGLGGSFLMMAGITLHGILGASLMRPAQWIPKMASLDGQNNNKYTAGDQNLNFLTKSEEVENLLNENPSSKNKTVSTIHHNGNDDDEDNSLLPNSKISAIIATKSNHLKQNGINGVSIKKKRHCESQVTVDEPHGTLQLIEDPQKPIYVGQDDNRLKAPRGGLFGEVTERSSLFRKVRNEPSVPGACLQKGLHLLYSPGFRFSDNERSDVCWKGSNQNSITGDQNLNFLTKSEEVENLLNENPSSKNKTVSTIHHNGNDDDEDNSLLPNSKMSAIIATKSNHLKQNGINGVSIKKKRHYESQVTVDEPHGTLQLIEDPQKPIYVVQDDNRLKGMMEPIKAACEIIKNPMFLIIASNYSIFFLSYMTYLIVIVDYSLDLGIDRTDCVFLVSTFSIADLIGRVGSGWITDSGIMKRKHLMMGNMILVGGLLAATSFTTTYIAVTAISVCTGLVVGINLILFYALLEEYLGIRQLPMAIGLMNFSIGVISLVTPLLTGYFRDTMGSYDHLFHLLGGASIFCGLLWILEPLSSRCNLISSTNLKVATRVHHEDCIDRKH